MLIVYVEAWEYLQAGHGHYRIRHSLWSMILVVYMVLVIVIAGALAGSHVMVGHGYYRDMYASLNLVIVYKLFK